jgi:hypothetical protein
MKKNYFKLISSILLTSFLVISCQKELKQINQGDEESTLAGGNGSIAKGCRLTTFDYYDGVADYHQMDHYTYKVWHC